MLFIWKEEIIKTKTANELSIAWQNIMLQFAIGNFSENTYNSIFETYYTQYQKLNKK